MKPMSIRLRLSLWYFAIFALTFAAYAVGVWLAMHASVHAVVDQELRTRLVGIQGFVQRHDPSVSLVDFQYEFREHSGLRPGGDLVQVSDPAGQLLFQSRSIQGYQIEPPRVSVATPTIVTLDLKGDRVRVLSATVTAGGRVYTAQLAARVAEAYGMLERFQWVLIAPIPVVLLLASAGGYWMSRRALAPVDAITRAARSIGEHSLSQRLVLPKAADELQRLAQTFNQMLERLDAAFKRITRFTADASHELRTPVALMRTTAELAVRQPRAEREYRDALGQILEEAERMTALIESLMTLARVDSGVEALTMTTVDLVGVIRQVCERSEPLMASKKIHFERATPGGPLLVSADAHAIERLFLILLDNAIRYTPTGGRIRVAVETDANAASVKIQDTGIGIPDVALPFIFERFYRVDPARSRKDGGAGLGLSIARWIADVHHTSIRVESRLGNGSTFEVRIPGLPAPVNPEDKGPAVHRGVLS